MTPSEPILDSTNPLRQARKQVLQLREALRKVVVANSLHGARWEALEGLREDRRIADQRVIR
jgi:hypothetical protein